MSLSPEALGQLGQEAAGKLYPAAGHQCWRSCVVVLDAGVPCSTRVSGSFNVSNWHSTHEETEAVAVMGTPRGSTQGTGGGGSSPGDREDQRWGRDSRGRLI